MYIALQEDSKTSILHFQVQVIFGQRCSYTQQFFHYNYKNVQTLLSTNYVTVALQKDSEAFILHFQAYAFLQPPSPHLMSLQSPSITWCQCSNRIWVRWCERDSGTAMAGFSPEEEVRVDRCSSCGLFLVLLCSSYMPHQRKVRRVVQHCSKPIT